MTTIPMTLSESYTKKQIMCFKSALRLPPSFWHCLIVSCHLIPLPYSCPIQPMQSWGDKKDSANTLVLPHTRGTISESRLRLSFTEMLCEEHVNWKIFLAVVCHSYDCMVKIFWHKKSPFKNGVYIKIKYILLPKVPFCSLCILCMKMKTFLREKSVLHHNKRNCFPSYPDHYLMAFF